MREYYYHGVSDLIDEISLDIISSIIRTGRIKTRQEIGNMTNQYNHVCLYKKNLKIDYSKKENFYRSARSGWIDHCFVFIINSNIEAVAEDDYHKTNLVDEWRSLGEISLDKIIGIAIPFDSIKIKEEKYGKFSNDFYRKLEKILEYARKNNWLIVNSDEVDFCDKVDLDC